eukprot:UN30328
MIKTILMNKIELKRLGFNSNLNIKIVIKKFSSLLKQYEGQVEPEKHETNHKQNKKAKSDNPSEWTVDQVAGFALSIGTNQVYKVVSQKIIEHRIDGSKIKGHLINEDWLKSVGVTKKINIKVINKKFIKLLKEWEASQPENNLNIDNHVSSSNTVQSTLS